MLGHIAPIAKGVSCRSADIAKVDDIHATEYTHTATQTDTLDLISSEEAL